MPDRTNKIAPWYRDPPTAEEIYPNDPIHYKRSEYSKLRVDGLWYRCFEPGCPNTHPSLRYIVYDKHFEKNFGEGERLKQVFANWRRAQTAAGLPKSPFDQNLNFISGAASLIQDFGPGWQNAQLAQPSMPVAPLAPRPAPNATLPPPPVQGGRHAGAQQDRPTVIKHQCYICKEWFSRRNYVPSHMFTQHKAELLREPCQPGRIISAECYRDTKVPIRLVPYGESQRPQFSLLCEELRELILQKLLAVPTYHGAHKGAIDKNSFKAFAINQATRNHALSVFGKYNFMIRVSIAGLDLDAMGDIEDYMSHYLQVLPQAVSDKIGDPALSIELEYDEGPRVGERIVVIGEPCSTR